MRILVVDDMSLTRRVLVNMLKSLGYDTVFESEDGEKAIQLLLNPNSKIDLLITDWLMPVIDGLTLTKLVRANKQTQDLPIIMLTIIDDKEKIVEAYKYKVNDYILKPFTIDVIKAKVENVLKNHNIINK